MTAALIPPGAPEFVSKFHDFRYSAFRLETLQSYGNSGEDADFEAFVTGRPKPANPGHERWQAMVGANVRAGRIVQRVHVVVEPLSQYMQLELTWGYGANAAAGEHIGIIPVLEGKEWPPDLPQGTDYWLFDSAELYHLHYDSEGTWLSTEIVTDPTRIVAACHWRDAALYHAMSWQEYIADQPELARRMPNSSSKGASPV